MQTDLTSTEAKKLSSYRLRWLTVSFCRQMRPCGCTIHYIHSNITKVVAVSLCKKINVICTWLGLTVLPECSSICSCSLIIITVLQLLTQCDINTFKRRADWTIARQTALVLLLS